MHLFRFFVVLWYLGFIDSPSLFLVMYKAYKATHVLANGQLLKLCVLQVMCIKVLEDQGVAYKEVVEEYCALAMASYAACDKNSILTYIVGN